MDRNRGAGPFTVGQPTQVHSNGEDYDVVEVLDATGFPFATVWAYFCVGGDIPAAKARAQRIAEALNRSVFRDGEQKLALHEFEERAGVVIGGSFVYPKGNREGQDQ